MAYALSERRCKVKLLAGNFASPASRKSYRLAWLTHARSLNLFAVPNDLRVRPRNRGSLMLTRRMKKSIAVITLLGVSLPLVAATDSELKQRTAAQVEGSQTIEQQRLAPEAVRREITQRERSATREAGPAMGINTDGLGPVELGPVELDRCGSFDPVNGEHYRWVEMDVDVGDRFRNDATNAGYDLSGPANQAYEGIPASFFQQKEAQYCHQFIDPAGFPHHISQARSCSLGQRYVSTAGGHGEYWVIELQYSGCYLESSTRRERPVEAVGNVAE